MAIFTTIGYGDIKPANTPERAMCLIIMLGGVFFYSYTIGTITSIMTESDRKQARLDSKMKVLNDIQKEFNMNKRFYKKLKQALEYDQYWIRK